MSLNDEQMLDRQLQIWTNLYGLRAPRLIHEVRDLMVKRPELSVADAIRLVDPEQEDDYIDFVATRW